MLYGVLELIGDTAVVSLFVCFACYLLSVSYFARACARVFILLFYFSSAVPYVMVIADPIVSPSFR